MNSGYRLLGLDLDGTLLNEELEIERSTAENLAALSTKGVEIVLCTGRRFSAALDYAHELGMSGPMVVNNGTIVKEIATGRTVYTDYFPKEHLTDLLPLLREMDLPAVLLTDEYPDYDFCVDVAEGANEYHTEYLEINREMGRIVDDLTAVQCETVSQVNVFHAYPTVLAADRRIRKAMDGKVGTTMIQHVKYKGCSLEMASLTASKWRALRWIAEQRGIKPEEIVAIGDDVNDIEMVREAGFGVAVANALDEVKAAADYITKQPYNLGIEEAIDLLFWSSDLQR